MSRSHPEWLRDYLIELDSLKGRLVKDYTVVSPPASPFGERMVDISVQPLPTKHDPKPRDSFLVRLSGTCFDKYWSVTQHLPAQKSNEYAYALFTCTNTWRNGQHQDECMDMAGALAKTLDDILKFSPLDKHTDVIRDTAIKLRRKSWRNYTVHAFEFFRYHQDDEPSVMAFRLNEGRIYWLRGHFDSYAGGEDGPFPELE
jgi:hypothetical protein